MFENEHGLPKPRHSYLHIPQPGRRGILVHNGQIPNGAQPTGVAAGSYVTAPAGVVAGGYGAGYHPGVYGLHTTPLYYGPNVGASTYSAHYYNYPSYSYYSPYANLSLGFGGGLYANYYHPYQKSYYYPSVATSAYPYGYPTAAMPVNTTYTVTNSHVVPMTTTTTTTMPTTTMHHSPAAPRCDVQHESRRVAMERGSYNPHRIKPSDALPDDPFWCRERTGEWHLRTFYQIENECYPGRWTMNADRGFLMFERN